METDQRRYEHNRFMILAILLEVITLTRTWQNKKKQCETGWIECSWRGGFEHLGMVDCCLIWTKITIKRENCTNIHQHVHPSKVTVLKTDMKGFVIKTFALKLWSSEPSHMTILVEWPLEDLYEGIDHKKLILLLHKEKCTSHNWKSTDHNFDNCVLSWAYENFNYNQYYTPSFMNIIITEMHLP